MNQETDPSDRIDVLIADDHNLILEIIALALEQRPDIRLSTALSVEGALEQLQIHGTFDLILLDLDMPGMRGVETLAGITLVNGGRPVGILTGHPAPHIVAELRRNGAAGVIPKTSSMRSLIEAIRLMAAGHHCFPTEDPDAPPQPARHVPAGERLTRREIPVLHKLAEGLTDAAIAGALTLAEPTVKMHVRTICRKLAASGRAEAVANAREKGLI